MPPDPLSPLASLRARVADLADPIGDAFHARLLALDPSLRARLAGADLRALRGAAIRTLLTVLDLAPDPGALVPAVTALAARHAAVGVRAGDYGTAGEALYWALTDVLGDSFVHEERAAWRETHALVDSLLRRAAGTERAT